MKKYVLLLLSLNLLAVNNRLFAQGSLTPPGPPGPTMRTLTQIEPRTPISTVFNISAPGSYYLTTNITCNLLNEVGISINASDVTLDLNGFTISSVANYSTVSNAGGIELGSGLSDISIRNGHIAGGITFNAQTLTYSEFGFGDGINYSGTPPVNVQVSGVTVSGCLYYGINLGTGNSVLVDGCSVNTVGSYGIEAGSILRSTAYQCGNIAITGNIASDCYGYSVAASGVSVSQTANNCYGLGFNGVGLEAHTANNCYGSCQMAGTIGLSATTATGCFGYDFGFSTGVGLAATIAIGCLGETGSGGTGLTASIANSCYGSGGSGFFTGTGMTATIANSCYSSSGDGGITNKYNMP